MLAPMSVLAVLLPPRPRRSGAPPAEFAYVLSPDGLAVERQGTAAPALLPRATTTVVVLAEADASWHHLTLPRAAPARMPQALLGLLEEQLLDEPEHVHFALAPQAAPGQPGWVAALDKPWLAGCLGALERGGVEVERVVPSAWPDAMAHGHFSGDADTGLHLTWSDAQGVTCLSLQGTLARSLLAQWQQAPARWSATPAVAAPAERWLDAPVTVLTAEQHALQATRSLWNLRQFDLAARHRGARALRDALRHWRSPQWRPLRWGVAALVALQLVGLNAWAWQQREAIESRRLQMVELLRRSHPQVRSVLDAPVQMQRETQLLRSAAGVAGAADLEALLGAAALAWPPGAPPAQTLRFEPGRLTLDGGGWTPQQVDTLRAGLRGAGYTVQASDGELVVAPATGGSP